VRILPPAAAVREALRAGGKADFAILLSHAPLEESRALLLEIPELDAVLSAHAGPSPLAKGEVHGGRVLLAPGEGWRYAGGAVFKEAEPGRRPTLLDQTFRAVGGGPGDVPPPTSPLLGETAYRLAEAGFLPGVLRKAAAAAPPGSPVLTGPGACGSCHPGAHAAWRSGTAHSRSMEKVREKAFGAVPDCLRCHATGAGLRGGHAEKGDAQDAVTCEACHGPGAAHAAADGKSALADAKASCAACHAPEMSPGFRFEEAWPRVVHGR
jgi:hypothetical protein